LIYIINAWLTDLQAAVCHFLHVFVTYRMVITIRFHLYECGYQPINRGHLASQGTLGGDEHYCNEQ
jgi:hypothetical protein